MGLLALAPQHAVKVPEDFQGLGDQGIRPDPEDPAPRKIGLEPLEDDHIGRNQKEGSGTFAATVYFPGFS